MVVGLLGISLVPRLLGYESVVVAGASMGDAAPLGSLAIGASVDPTGVRVGDVILVRSLTDGRLSAPVLHRAISVDHVEGSVVIQTKGDANQGPDPLPHVLTERTMVLRHVVPHVGFVLGYARTPLGWALMVAFRLAVFAGAAVPTPKRPPARGEAGQDRPQWDDEEAAA